MKNFYQLLMQYWLSFKLLLLRYDEDCCRENKHIVKHIWASKWLKIKQSEAEFKKVRAYKKKKSVFVFIASELRSWHIRELKYCS